MKPYKLIILIICFVLTSFLIYRQPSSKAVSKQVPLSQALSEIQGWTMSGYTPLDTEIVKALELDDYANQNYSNGHAIVSLYIGYYLTTGKIGASSSPLICFPSQGWVISNEEKKSLKIGSHDLQVTSMVVTKGEEKHLVLYWFQAFDKTSPGTFLQKIYGLWAKVFYQKEDNAFVRVMVPMNGQSMQEALSTSTEFIEAFYPRFLKYVNDDKI